jgi:hypothetical protein
LGVQRARAEQSGERERKRQLARTVTAMFVLRQGRGHQSSRAKTEGNSGIDQLLIENQSQLSVQPGINCLKPLLYNHLCRHQQVRSVIVDVLGR